MTSPLVTSSNSSLATSATIQGQHSKLFKAIAALITFFFGVGKSLQSAGQSAFSVSLKNDLGLPIALNSAFGWSAVVGSFIVSLLSRVPRIYRHSSELLGRCQKTCACCGPRPADTEEKQGLLNTPATTSLDFPEDPLKTHGHRRRFYKVALAYFVVSGFLSLIFTTINAIQSGAILMRKLQGLPTDDHSSPNALVYFGAIYVPLCTLISYASFNLTRIVANSRETAHAIATVGLEGHQFSKKKKVVIAAAAILSTFFTIGYAAYSVISTQNALLATQTIFLGDNTPKLWMEYFGIVSGIPGIASVLLNYGVDLFKIFEGKIPLFRLKPLHSSGLRYAIFGVIALAGIADAVLGNGIGFFSSIGILLMDWFGLKQETSYSKGIAGFFALMSILPYFANNGAQALQVIQRKKDEQAPASCARCCFWKKPEETKASSSEAISNKAGGSPTASHIGGDPIQP